MGEKNSMMCGLDESGYKIICFRLYTLLISIFIFFMSKSVYGEGSIIILVTLIGVNLIAISLQYKGLEESYALLLWFIESIGLFAVVMITGGLKSPYFWLIINPTLVGLYLSKKNNVIIHVLLMIMIGLMVLSSFRQGSNSHGMIEITNIFGVSIIIFRSIFLTNGLKEQRHLQKELLKSNNELKEQLTINEEMNENFIQSIYLLEKITMVDDYNDLKGLLTRYFIKIFGDDRSFIYNKGNWRHLGPEIDECEKQYILNRINKNSEEMKSCIDSSNYDKSMEYDVIMEMLSYFSDVEYIGIVGTQDRNKNMAIKKQLSFIVKLHEIAVSKISINKLQKEIYRKDEQNRIAEEMHDNVNQQLFALNCHIFNMKNEIYKDSPDMIKLKEMIDFSNMLINRTNKDLKKIIYKMSIKKGEVGEILTEITSYIEELSELYNVKIYHDIDLDIVHINIKTQEIIFRVISEGISNSVRHGKAKNIRIIIKVNGKKVEMVIEDDGIGIDIDKISKQTVGLGLHNLEKISIVNEGYFSIKPVGVNGGTVLNIHIGEVKTS